MTRKVIFFKTPARRQGVTSQPKSNLYYFFKMLPTRRQGVTSQPKSTLYYFFKMLYTLIAA
jgi:hypothetical protein